MAKIQVVHSKCAESTYVHMRTSYIAGGVEIVSVVRIRVSKKWVAGARIQAQSTGGRCMDRALINTWGRVKGQIEGKWVGVA